MTFVVITLCAVTKEKVNNQEDFSFSSKINLTNSIEKCLLLEAKTIPPIIRPRPPKMYEEPISFVAESHKLA